MLKSEEKVRRNGKKILLLSLLVSLFCISLVSSEYGFADNTKPNLESGLSSKVSTSTTIITGTNNLSNGGLTPSQLVYVCGSNGTLCSMSSSTVDNYDILLDYSGANSTYNYDGLAFNYVNDGEGTYQYNTFGKDGIFLEGTSLPRTATNPKTNIYQQDNVLLMLGLNSNSFALLLTGQNESSDSVPYSLIANGNVTALDTVSAGNDTDHIRMSCLTGNCVISPMRAGGDKVVLVDGALISTGDMITSIAAIGVGMSEKLSFMTINNDTGSVSFVGGANYSFDNPVFSSNICYSDGTNCAASGGTYNETYDATTKAWNGNYSILAGAVNNASYLSTYNATYDAKVSFNNTNLAYVNNSNIFTTNQTINGWLTLMDAKNSSLIGSPSVYNNASQTVSIGLYSVDIQNYRENVNQSVSGNYGVAVGGTNIVDSQSYGVAIGNNHRVTGQSAIAIGGSCTLKSIATYGICIGGSNVIGDTYDTAIGSAMNTWGQRTTALGYTGTTTEFDAIVSLMNSKTLQIQKESKILMGTNVTIVDLNNLGSELIVNGTFTDGLAPFVNSTSIKWDSVAKTANKTAAASGTLTYNLGNLTSPLKNNTYYLISFYLDNIAQTTTSFKISIAGYTSETITQTAYPITYQRVFKAINGSDMVITMGGGIASRYRLDNVSLKEIKGGDLEVFGQTTLNNVNITGNLSVKRPYGMYSSTQTQTIAVANTPYPVTFNVTEDSYQIYKASDNSNFSFAQTGDYLIELSAIVSTDLPNKHIEMWVQKNGINVPRSNTKLEISTAGLETTLAVPFIIDMNTTDSFRIMYASDDAGSQLVYTTNTSYSPESPSIIMTMTKISELT